MRLMKAAAIILVILAVVGGGAWFVLRNDGSGESYRFVTVERGTIESVVSSTGTLRATSTVQVGTQVSGRIEAIYVDFNDRVEKGQLVARIDPTLLEQEVRSAKASVARAEAEVAQAESEMKRSQRLYEGKVITDSEYTNAEYQLAVARSSLESARINLDRAERNLTYSEIRAPVDGTVLERNVEAGQTVAASLQAPQLFLIAGDLSEMEIVALVDESDIGRIAVGQSVRFTVQAFPDRYFDGLVHQVRLQSTTQENVVNYMVAVSVDNADGRLLPGMTATVEFIVERAEDVLMVSNTALRFQPTESMRATARERREQSQAGDADSTRRAARREGGRRSGGDRPAGNRGAGGEVERARLWTVDETGKVLAVPVVVGLTDGRNTLIGGPRVTEGMQVIAAVTTEDAGEIRNPFQGENNSSRRRGGF